MEVSSGSESDASNSADKKRMQGSTENEIHHPSQSESERRIELEEGEILTTQSTNERSEISSQITTTFLDGTNHGELAKLTKEPLQTLLSSTKVNINIIQTSISHTNVAQQTNVDKRKTNYNFRKAHVNAPINIGASTSTDDCLPTVYKAKEEEFVSCFEDLKAEDMKKYSSVKCGIKKINKHYESIKDILLEVAGVNKDVSEVHPTMNEVAMEQYLAQQETDQHEYDPRKAFNYKAMTSSNSVIIQDLHKNGRYVMILGEAGSGKTTLSRRYLKKIANKSIKRLQHITIVLHVQFKDLNDPNPVYLYEFIIGGAAAKMTKKERVDLLDYMSNNEKEIAIILDGLDQLQAEIPKSDETMINFFDKFTQIEFVHAILSGKIFTGSKILLLSRPNAMKKLPHDSLPEYVITLGGLLSKDVDLLLTQLGGDDAKLYLKHQNLKAYLLCSNPLMLVYVVASFNKMKSCPSSVTGVILCVIKNLFHSEKHARSLDNDALKRLCSLAYDGTNERRVTFFIEDLQKHALSLDDVSDMMFVIPKSDSNSIIIKQAILRGQYYMYFSHQTLQEVLASVHVFHLHLTEIRLFLNHSFADQHWEMIMQSLYAMVCNKGNLQYFASLIDDPNLNKLDDMRAILCDVLTENLSTPKDAFQVRLMQIETALMDEDISDERRKFLRDYKTLYHNKKKNLIPGLVDVTILNFIKECDDSVDEIVKKHVNGVELSFHSFTSHTVSSLKDLLHKVDKLKLLHLRGCNLKPEHLLELMNKTNEGKLPQIDDLGVSNDGIVGETLGRFVSETNPRILGIKSCNLTEDGLCDFVNSLDDKIKFKEVWLNANRLSLEMMPEIKNLMSRSDEVMLDERNTFADAEVKQAIKNVGKNTKIMWYEGTKR